MMPRLIMLMALSAAIFGGPSVTAQSPDCRSYVDVRYIKEADDTLGKAIQICVNGRTVSARLMIWEGGPDPQITPLCGSITGTHLTLTGKTTVSPLSVEAVLTGSQLRGTLQLGVTKQQLKLSREKQSKAGDFEGALPACK